MASHHPREELLAASALGVGGFGADDDREGEEGGEESEGDDHDLLLSVARRGRVMQDGETPRLLYAKNIMRERDARQEMHESGTAPSSNFYGNGVQWNFIL